MSEYFPVWDIQFTWIHIKVLDSIVSSNEAYFSQGFHQQVWGVIFYFFPSLFFLMGTVGLPAAMSVHHVHEGWKPYFFKEGERDRL